MMAQDLNSSSSAPEYSNATKRKTGKKTIDALMPKIRQEVLTATIMHSKKRWYLADLSRHLNRNPSSLRNELIKLTEAGISNRSQEGRNIYYQPNTDNPLLVDIKNLLTKSVGLLDVLREVLEPFAGKIYFSFVYGSFARSEEHSESDVDLLVVGSLRLSEIASKISEAERKLGRDVNPTFLTCQEVVDKLEQNNHFLRTVFSDEKFFLIGDVHVMENVIGSGKDTEPQNQQGRD